MALPKEVEILIGELSKLPGVGRRSAERMAFDLVFASEERLDALSDAIGRIRGDVGTCPECGYFTSGGRCLICCEHRHHETILVVERALDVVAFEKSGGYRGMYHVLGGHLSPLKGIAPEDLRMAELFQRIEKNPVSEIVLATSSTVEGDATALYISRHIENREIRVTRLGRGVPMGGSLEMADSGTLRLALEGRRAMEHPNG